MHQILSPCVCLGFGGENMRSKSRPITGRLSCIVTSPAALTAALSAARPPLRLIVQSVARASR